MQPHTNKVITEPSFPVRILSSLMMYRDAM